MTSGPVVAVLGASGFTGALVAREGSKRGLPLVLLGRDEGALRAFADELDGVNDVRVVDATGRDLSRALHAVDVVIHCAGPFAATQRPVDDAGLQTGTPVVSMAGELALLRARFQRDDEARAAKTALVGPAGFSTAASELACWLAAQKIDAPRRIELARANQRSVPSLGSLASYLAGVDEPPVGFRGGQLVEEPPATVVKVVDFGGDVGERAVASTPSAELLVLPRQHPVTEIDHLLDVGPPRAASIASRRISTQDAEGLRELVRWREAQGSRGPSPEERRQMGFVLIASVEDHQGRRRTVTLRGRDPYGLTAVLGVQTAVDVVERGLVGALSPGEVLVPQPALAALARAGTRWTVSETQGRGERAARSTSTPPEPVATTTPPAREVTSVDVEPFDDDDEAITAHLEHASVPALLASLVHVTGRTDVLDGDIRPRRAAIGELQGFLPAAEQAAARRLAREALARFRDDGGRAADAPTGAALRRLMSFVVGEDVPERYVDMMQEELGLTEPDARRPAPVRTGSKLSAIIIGAGMSGVLASIRLAQAGVEHTLLEKNVDVGGTWLENTYPGCRVDIPNHMYCYSFAPDAWSQHFSTQPELLAYFQRCAEAFGVRERVQFSTEVVSARFDEASALWHVATRGPDGEQVLRANALISAVGQLNRPKIPSLDGRAAFNGRVFHSAAWQHDAPLDGAVAVVGTGASALQIVPELARTASRLTVFQRSPPWIFPNPRYHQPVTPGAAWLMRHVPGYARWYRFLLFWPASDGLLPTLEIDPTWTHPERSVNERNDDVRAILESTIRAQVGADDELLKKVIPTYPPFAKRMLQDDGGWIGALKQPNVDLVTSPIERFSLDGVVTADGVAHKLDVVVMATGFHANRFLWPMEIVGRGARRLADVWGDDPQAYLGITVPGFPNLFCLYGPGTNLAHSGSIVFQSECQVRYVVECLRALGESGATTMECKPEVHDAFNERHQAAMHKMVWSHPAVSSWYKNAAGRIRTTSPWRLVDYWSWTRRPNLDDYVLS